MIALAYRSPADQQQQEEQPLAMQNMNDATRDEMNATDDDEQEEQEEDEEQEQGFNTPAVYLDGTALAYDALPMPEELERVQLAFPDTENGYQTEAQERAPLGWCNSAAIEIDREDDSVALSISVGDPRGAFTFTVRRATDGSLQMFYPTPAESQLHMPLRRIRDGLYRIGK